MTSEQRHQAILKAGLDVFASEGFAAARLDTVAQKAGVAKGTIYLYFTDKQDLFEKIILNAVTPLLSRLSSANDFPDMPAEAFLTMMFDTFKQEVLGTDRRHIIRLVMTEGARFPAIAEFYHREVITKAKDHINAVITRALERGETLSPAVKDHPHLIIAPLVMAVMWDGLFSEIEPLDLDELLQAHRSLLMQQG